MNNIIYTCGINNVCVGGRGEGAPIIFYKNKTCVLLHIHVHYTYV